MAKIISQTIVIDVQKLVPNRNSIIPLITEANLKDIQSALEEILGNNVVEIEVGESEFKT